MNVNDLKRKMIALWKESFHDSEDYINLIFDRYFDPEFVESETAGPEIISAVMGIPYDFGGEECRIRGLFLCGMATKQRYRGQGIMGNLLEKINRKATEKGFAFTFLIPIGERSHRYFFHQGYVDAFYRCEENYTSLHNFAVEYESVLELQKGKVADLKRHHFEVLEGADVQNDTPDEVLENIKNLLHERENDQSDMEVLHSREQLSDVIEMNRLKGGKIYYVSGPQDAISAVAFTRLVDRSRVEIERMVSKDDCSTYRLLDFIKKNEPDAGIKIFIDPKTSDRKNLAKTHGMARILNLCEILKFPAAGHGDLKYSILVNEHPGLVERYDIKGGQVNHKSIRTDSEDYDPTKTVMSLRDISCVLFRRPDTGVLLVEAFGMPSLGGYVSLMAE